MSDRNHTGAVVNFASDYVQSHENTRDNLKMQITNHTLDLEKKKFTLALLKNKESTYEKLIKSFVEEKKSQTQIIRSLQQQVFENRINFSNELIMFAGNDITASSDEVLKHHSCASNEHSIAIATDDSKPEFEDDVGVEWNMNSFEYKLHDDEDLQVVDGIQIPNEPKHENDDRKVKFVFKQPKT